VGTKRKISNILDIKESKKVTVREAIDDLPILINGNSIDELEYPASSKLSTYQKKMRAKRKKNIFNNLVTKNNSLVIKRYSKIPPGGNWKNIPPELMQNYKNINNCHSGIYHRLTWDKPSIVISNYRKNMLIHPDQNRGLSVREAARIQSFPDKYIFYGPLESQQQQVANAVPPLLAEKIGYNIIKKLEI
jgi:DNA (cytosine-5)-methyltransferase 1